jgi:hypothetical protein
VLKHHLRNFEIVDEVGMEEKNNYPVLRQDADVLQLLGVVVGDAVVLVDELAKHFLKY